MKTILSSLYFALSMLLTLVSFAQNQTVLVQIDLGELTRLRAKADSITGLKATLAQKDSEIISLITGKKQAEARAAMAETAEENLTKQLTYQKELSNDFQKTSNMFRGDALKLKVVRDSVRILSQQVTGMEKLQSENETLKRTNTQNQNAIQLKDAELARIKAENTRNDGQIRDQGQRIANLDQEIGQKNSQIAQLSEMVGRLKSAILERVRAIVGTYSLSQYEPNLIQELKQQMQMIIQSAKPGQEQQEARNLLNQLEAYETLAKANLEAKTVLARDYDSGAISGLLSRLNSHQTANPALNNEKKWVVDKLNGYPGFYQEVYNFFFSTQTFTQKNIEDVTSRYLSDKAWLKDYPFLLSKVQYLKDNPGCNTPQCRMPLRKIN